MIPMPEFTICIDTHGGTVYGDEWELVVDALDKGPALGPAISMSRTGVLGATFQVEARGMVNAARVGVNAFRDALHAADIWESSWEVDHHGDPLIARFTVSHVCEDEVGT